MTRDVLTNSSRSRQDINSGVSAPATLHIMIPNCDTCCLFGSHPKRYSDYCGYHYEAQTLYRHWPKDHAREYGFHSVDPQ